MRASRRSDLAQLASKMQPFRDSGAAALVARAPRYEALLAATEVLSSYPAHVLETLASRGVRLWLLDRGEAVSAAPIPASERARWCLGERGRQAAWAGLTVPTPGGPLVVAPWDRPTVVRHELGHAIGALLDDQQRRRLGAAYRTASVRGRWLVPLAARSVGEYLACGAACFARSGGPAYLRAFDPALADVLEPIWARPRTGVIETCDRPGILRRTLAGLGWLRSAERAA